MLESNGRQQVHKIFCSLGASHMRKSGPRSEEIGLAFYKGLRAFVGLSGTCKG
jgi:hypothetical protein